MPSTATRSYSKASYRSLLDLAIRKGYRFTHFSDEEGPGERRIYLRHDVDYSLGMALELAEVNHSMGVQGTFCVLLRSHVYNLLTHWSLQLARRIRDLGQHLAFHCTVPSPLPASDEELAGHVLADFETVRRYLPEVEPAFAWHNATSGMIERGRNLEVPGLLNLYSRRFTQDIAYFSDSNMRYSVQELEDIIEKEDHAALQLLCHPINWVAGGRNMLEVMAATWTYIIREREEEFRLNRSYAQAMPNGMPEGVLDLFSAQWLEAALRKSE